MRVLTEEEFVCLSTEYDDDRYAYCDCGDGNLTRGPICVGLESRGLVKFEVTGQCTCKDCGRRVDEYVFPITPLGRIALACYAAVRTPVSYG